MIYKGTVRHGVVEFEGDVTLPDGTPVKIEPMIVRQDQDEVSKRPGTSLADWAEENAEDWDDQLNSEDVEGFTGRRF